MDTAKTTILHASSDAQIAATFDVMKQLRPDLERGEYVSALRGLMATEGLRMLALSEDDVVRAVATYRIMNMLYCGRLLSIDDLVSDETCRSRGFGGQLIERLKEEARAAGCNEVQLISRVSREDAHRFYFRQGFGIDCFHFRVRLD